MVVHGKCQKVRRQRVDRPEGYYEGLRQELAVQGYAQPQYAAATRRNLKGSWEKWKGYCEDVKREPIDFIKCQSAADYKAFCRWVLDKYPGVTKHSTIHEYWRQLRMHYQEHANERMPKIIKDDVNNYLRDLTVAYKLTKTQRKKPVLSNDDLFVLQFHHWVRCERVYPDEEQRLGFSLLLKFAAATGARPVSLVDATVQVADEDAGSVTRDQAIRFYDPDEEDTADEGSSEIIGLETGELPPEEELMSVLFEHVTIMLIRVEGRPTLVMYLTLIHTKGEDRKPQPKTFRMYQRDNPWICPIWMMITMGLLRNAFAASNVRGPEDILLAKIPEYKDCVIFRWKKEQWEEPIFREPKGSKYAKSRSGRSKPLRAATAARYMKRLGQDVGVEMSLTHTCIRRGVGNAVNHKAPAATRDQIMGHGHSGIFQSYINPDVEFDVQAAYIDEPSQTAVIKAMGNMTLTRDPLAPTKLSLDDAVAINQNDTVVKLRQQRDGLTKAIKEVEKRDGRNGVGAGEEVELLRQLKKDAEAKLHRKKMNLRARKLSKVRETYFLENDTRALEQAGDMSLVDGDKGDSTATTYALEHRALLADMLCRPAGNLHELGGLRQRIELIRTATELCACREVRGRAKVYRNPVTTWTEEVDKSVPPSFSLECDPRQCLFCIGDERLDLAQRKFSYARAAKMMDHIEKDHLAQFEAEAKISCPHPTCQKVQVVLDGVSHFKAHASRVHKITLRLPKAAPF